MTAKIAAVHAASEGTYGVSRVTAELRETGQRRPQRAAPGNGWGNGPPARPASRPRTSPRTGSG
ncbi:hypothetical protein ACIPD2_07670 [Streptomyces griseofuscus]|uniref:hypothetical protein n=1 Tax=Streptomyces TaxID=1883 RepID=UPI0035AB6F24